ncbi:MAG TPA: metallophosphoesterase [Streptomyces sp.]|nr:metallophosphoesterase [Streptomyces sp.]
MIVVAVLAALVVLALLVAVHWYVWRRTVRDVSAPGGWWRRTGTVLIVLLPLCTVGTMAVRGADGPWALQQVLAWPGFLWLALLLYLTLALAVGEAVRPLLRRALSRRAPAAAGGAGDETAPAAATEAGAAPTTPSRRVFVARVVAGAAGAAGVATVGAGARGVFDGPTTKHVTIPLRKLPRSAHGYRIAVVSDVHLGPILGRSFTRRVVDAINATQPDLVAIVGDLVDGTVDQLGSAVHPLTGLRSRHGSYFVTGNHEYYGNHAAAWIDELRDLGVHPLQNARRELPGFDLAGVNDLAGTEEGHGPDFARALGDRDTSRASVLMAHQPVQIHKAVDYGVGLQLSGHTHGGQLWPGPYLAALANPTVAGLERYGDTQLYVTRGAGAWGPPVRVGAESDITVVTLASTEA